MSHLLLLSLDTVGHISRQPSDAVYSGNLSSEHQLLVLITLKEEYQFCTPCAVKSLPHFVQSEHQTLTQTYSIEKSGQKGSVFKSKALR